MAANWFRRYLQLGDTGSDVALVNRKLKSRGGDTYTTETEAKVRGLQKANGMAPTGDVGELTSDLIGESIRRGMVPDWYYRPIAKGDSGEDVTTMRRAIGLVSGWVFTPEVEAAVRRFQSEHGLPLTGVVDEGTAIQIGDDATLDTV